MNKKVVLSVLSTAVVASLATSAFAAPSAGLYIGGNVDKYYSLTDFVNNEVSARGEINSVGLDNVLYIDSKGNGATVKKVALADSLNDALTKVTLGDFAGNVYKNAKTGEIYDPSKDPDVTGLPTGDLQVTSVSALNAAQIEVKFGAAVEKKSAENADNYVLDSYLGDKTAKLVNDTTVVLTLDPAAVANLQQETKTLTVADVKSATDESKKIETFTGKVSFLDLTLPTATEAKLVGPGKVQVFFSEPVQPTNGKLGFLIDGGQYSVTVDKYDAVTKSVTLLTGSLSLGNHTVTVNPDGDKAVKDGAGLLVNKTDLTLAVSDDTTAPTLVTATATSQYELVFTFDEAITGLNKDNVYHTAKRDAYKASETEEVVGSNGKQWKVKFSNPLPTGNVTISIDKEAIQDAFGNKNSEVLSKVVSVTADTVKPTVTELKVVDASQVTLTFSEDVTGADSKANYKVTDKDGKTVTGYGIKYEDKKATITFNPVLKEGATYTIELTGVKDNAVVPNEINKYVTNFTVTDKTAPEVTKNGVYDKDAHKIVIFFSEAIKGADLLDKSKYTLVAGNVQVELPASATLAVGPNNTSVNITLPSVVKDAKGNDITNSINQVIVGQVRDFADNKTATVYSTVDLNSEAADITDKNVVANSAVTVDTKTVQFTINKPLKTVIASDFTVNDKGVEFAKYENKTLKDGTFGSVITLQVAAKDAWGTADKPVIKTAEETKSVSLYGDKFAPGTSLATTLDGVAPAIAAGDDNKLDGKDLEYAYDAKGNVTEVTVTFTEALKQSTLSVEDFEVPGYEVADLKLVNGKQVKISLDPSVEKGTSFKVNFVGSVADTEGNVFNTAKEITVAPDDYAAGSDDAAAKAAAIEAANTKIAAIPATITAQNLTEAKSAVSEAEKAVSAAKEKGAADSDFTGLDKIETANAEIAKLEKDAADAETLKAAQDAVSALFKDDTKQELADGVGQAEIDAAQEKVNLVADGTAKEELQADIDAANALVVTP